MRPATLDVTLIEGLKRGDSFSDLARANGVSAEAIRRRALALPPRTLVQVLAQRRHEQVLVKAQVDPVDIPRELFAIRAGVQETLANVKRATGKQLSFKDKCRLGFMAYERLLRWITTLIDGNRELLKLAAVSQWQAELVVVLQEASPELRARFMEKLAAKGYLPMAPVDSSGFTPRADQEGEERRAG